MTELCAGPAEQAQLVLAHLEFLDQSLRDITQSEINLKNLTLPALGKKFFQETWKELNQSPQEASQSDAVSINQKLQEVKSIFAAQKALLQDNPAQYFKALQDGTVQYLKNTVEDKETFKRTAFPFSPFSFEE